ncbi:MAG: hypothetical protein P0Y64_09040 [Candidatus Sphingomonas colombiensis]|nr:hypothetical protein [Sphingomonas sp.]WEK44900.1 MAG: hypothetical protein P0Y64_09040 [Sphingomonas sp.]
MMRSFPCAAAALLATGWCWAMPVQAEVLHAARDGFEISVTTIAAATPELAWDTLVSPALWWDGVHSWSGDSRDLSLDPRAGGCFCERLPPKGDEQAGSVEHGRVIFVRPPHMLRLASALGPLQAEAVSGVLTFTIAPGEAGHSKLTLHYVVGGYFRSDATALAPVVDSVLGAQVARWRAAVERRSSGK